MGAEKCDVKKEWKKVRNSVREDVKDGMQVNLWKTGENLSVNQNVWEQAQATYKLRGTDIFGAVDIDHLGPELLSFLNACWARLSEAPSVLH